MAKEKKPIPQSSETEEQGFLKEKKKKRPINRERLARRTMVTILMGILFGLVASITFLVLQPIFSRWITPAAPEAEPEVVTFPEDLASEEMSPEEMLSDYMQQEAALNQEDTQTGEEGSGEEASSEELPLSQEQISRILSQVTLNEKSYRQLYFSLASLVRQLSRSMVVVDAQTSDENWLSSVDVESRKSSGVIVAENGLELLILADASTLKYAERIRIIFNGGLTADAEIKEVDPETGLGILAVKLWSLDSGLRNNPPIARLGSSSYAYLGSPVIALGSPLGTTGSISYGMISASSTDRPGMDVALKLLQTDIVGSAGCSGVLFNLQGQVVGILTSERNAGLESLLAAYGISELKSRIEKMANGEALSYLGITGMDVTKEANERLGVPFGAYILSVEMDSPAMTAGLQAGDIVTSMNGSVISSMYDYSSQLQSRREGDSVELRVQRQVQDEYKEIIVTMVVEGRS